MAINELRTARATAARMAEAASAFLSALTDEQRAEAVLPFADEDERRTWYYFPHERRGLALAKMDHEQQKLAHRLVASGLSLPAYTKAAMVIALENVLYEIEQGRSQFIRDPALYHVTVFGVPGQTEPWGWRFDGHHVSLHYTIVDDYVASPTPTFFGSNPAEVRHGDYHVLRLLGEEEDLGRALLLSLDASQRAQAIICPVASPDILTRNLPVLSQSTVLPVDMNHLQLTEEQRHLLRYEPTPRGLPAAAMSDRQREMMLELIRLYTDRMPNELAEAAYSRVTSAGIERLHFAWAGEAERGRPHYYRIQGPNFLVEYDNTQNDVNHIHTVWRDPTNDFGDEILKQHYKRFH